MDKRLVLFSLISAMLISGCGRKSPTEPAKPIAMEGSTTAPANPAASSMTDIDPAVGGDPDLGDDMGPVGATSIAADPAATAPSTIAASTEPAAGETVAPIDEAAAKKAAEDAAKKAEEEAKLKSEEAARIKAADEAKKKAEADAAKVLADEAAKRKADEAKVISDRTPAFVKSIGNGSLHSAHGLAVAGGLLYVVDTQRTGLLGKFSAVRQYDVSSGDFMKSFENIGWLGAKNMPTTVDRVKLVSGNVVAGDSSKSYTFDASGTLLKTEDVGFANTTEVTDPKTHDIFRLAGGQVARVHDGTVVLTFGEAQLDEGNAIAVTDDGSLFVSEKNKGLVHQFAPAKN